MMPQNQPYKQGDVILVLFPNSDLRTAKVRPALVIQADALQTGLQQVVVAMISSQMQRAGHPSRIKILLSTMEGQTSGLLTDSVIMTDNIATVAENALYRVIGSFAMTEVYTALRQTLGL